MKSLWTFKKEKVLLRFGIESTKICVCIVEVPFEFIWKAQFEILSATHVNGPK